MRRGALARSAMGTVLLLTLSPIVFLNAARSSSDDFVLLMAANVEAGLPPSVVVSVVRVVLAPGAVTASVVNAGPTLLVLESGDLLEIRSDGPLRGSRRIEANRRPELVVSKGEPVYVPAGVEASFRNVGEKAGKLLVVVVRPGG